jgi:hypothetical protein
MGDREGAQKNTETQQAKDAAKCRSSHAGDGRAVGSDKQIALNIKGTRESVSSSVVRDRRFVASRCVPVRIASRMWRRYPSFVFIEEDAV